MPTTLSIDPVTRLEGHLKIEVTVDYVSGRQQVVDAKATGTLFRGFETILKSRPPLDAPDITQRICGVCPVSHGLVASMALESAARAVVPENARIMRNLVLGSNFVQSHILHFYHLAALDFVDGPDMPPWQPSWKSDKRLGAAASQALVNNYVKALEIRRKAHEMGALFGGRLPHPPTFVPGGFTTAPRSSRISKFLTYVNEIIGFIENVYANDVYSLAQVYSDYYSIGRGPGRLLAFGVFDESPDGSQKLLRRGLAVNGAFQPLDIAKISEHVTYSWYSGGTAAPANGSTTPQYPKANAYSWLKAPRYAGGAYEVGPLARMWVNGDYNNGVSVMDRHHARMLEAKKVAYALRDWVGQRNPGGQVYQLYITPASGAGVGLAEAPRGALGHWVNIAAGRTANYQVVTPTCWNASPRDSAGRRGPLEEALIGTPVADLAEPNEVVRVIHSFDPCLSCAVHVMRPAEGKKVFSLGHFHAEQESSSRAHEHLHEHHHGHAGHSH